MMLWQVGHMASGSHHRKAPKPLPPHPILSPATQSGRLLWQWVQPRQTLPASSPCTGHQLYLPQWGNALTPRPSTICPPRLLRRQSSLGHPLPSHQSHTGDRPGQIAALWERLDAALCPFPAPAPTLTQVPTTPGQLVPHHIQGEGETNPLVS